MKTNKTLLALAVLLLIAAAAEYAERFERASASSFRPAVTAAASPETEASGDAIPSATTTDPSQPSAPLTTPITVLADSEVDRMAASIEVTGRTIVTLDVFAECPNLKELSFYRCTFADDAVLPAIETLESLSLTACGPMSVNVIKNNTQVKCLALSYNDLADIDILKNFHNLIYLSLLANQITDLSPLSGAEELTELNLLDGNAGIVTLKPLFGLKKLEILRLDYGTSVNVPKEDLLYFGYDPETDAQGTTIIEVD